MVLSYQLYQQPLDPLGQEIDRFWSVLFTMDSKPSHSMMTDEDMGGNAAPQSAICIGGLHASFSEAHLVKLLMPFGKLEQLQMVSHEGCALCSFASPLAAQACVQKLHGRMLLGRVLAVAPFNTNHNRSKRPFGEDTMNCMTVDMDMDSSPVRAIRRKLNEDSYCAY